MPEHSLGLLKRAVRAFGIRMIDRRTALGKTLTRWRAELIADLGGTDAISTQQAALVELAVTSKLLLDSVDAWLLTQPSLVNRRTRALLPVVRERTQLADSLARYLIALGLDRRARAVPHIHDYVARRVRQAGPHRPGPALPSPQDETAPRPSSEEHAEQEHSP